MSILSKVALSCGVMSFAFAASAATIYVSPEGAGAQDGSSPENAATLSILRSKFGSWFKTGEENVVQLLDSETAYSVPNDDTVFDFNNGNTKYVVFQGNVEDPSKVVLDMSTDLKGNRGYVVRAPGRLRGITFKNFTQKGTSYPGVICAFVAFNSGVFCVENCRFENCVSTATSGEQCSGTVVRYYNNNAGSSTSNLIMSNCVFASCSAYNRGVIWKGYQERAPYWFSHSSSWRTGVVSGLLFGPLFFPLMYLLATCVLPFSPFFPFALMSAPAAAASVVRARTIWRTSKRSLPKTIFVFIVTYWPEALILPLLDR